MTQHVHYDLIVWWASDPFNNIVQFQSNDGDWVDFIYNVPAWDVESKYRKKPQAVTHERWLNLDADGHLNCWPTKEAADNHAFPDRVECRQITWTIEP